MGDHRLNTGITFNNDNARLENCSVSSFCNHTNYADRHSPKGHGHHGGGLHVAALAYEEVRDPLIFTIVVLLTGISKIGYHHANILSSRVPESCILIILGTAFGAVFHVTGISESLPEFFKPHEFFMFLLPPIILEAAFSLHDRTFTENIGSILLFAVLGTILACVLLGGTLYGLAKCGAMGEITQLSFMEIMVFSSLIVAVDPVAVLAVFNEIGVNHVLYFLVFGESLLNDGVTVVLYKVFQAYNIMDEVGSADVCFLCLIKFFVVCLGGLLLGVASGLATAILTKFSSHVKVAQPIIIFTMAYFGFLLAELFEFSGIISIIGCGLTQMHYAFHNISDKSRTTIMYFTKVISSANEIIIFLFLGLSLVNDDHDWHTGFTLWTIFFCLVYRFIIIFGMSYAINWLDIYRVRKISLHEQFMIAYGGLRGAVCFSLVALLNPHDLPTKDMFVTTTLAVIVFTVFVQGITIKPLVYLLQISLAPERSPTMYKELNSHVTDHLMAGIEDIIGDHGRNHLRERIDYIDGKYLKPLLQLAPDPGDTTLKAFYENLLLKEHYNYLKLSGAKTPGDAPELPRMNTEGFLSGLASGVTSVKLQPDKDVTDAEPPSPDGRHRNRSYSVGTDIDAKGLRSLLLSQKNSRMALSKYDRNLTETDNIQTEIRKKTTKNRRLERLFSQDALATPNDRRKSWGGADTTIGVERGQARRAPFRHALTLDLGSTGHLDSGDPSSAMEFSHPSSPPLDSLFEEDEEAESKPMMGPEGNKLSRGS
ncbi:unnamed protein product, partial [Candidula unifasciata]